MVAALLRDVHLQLSAEISRMSECTSAVALRALRSPLRHVRDRISLIAEHLPFQQILLLP